MENLLNALKELDIKYQIQEHGVLLTIEDAKKINYVIPGIGTKTLFLKSRKREEYYIVVIHEDKMVDFKLIKQALQCGAISFASEEDAERILNLKGGLTPCGIINDKDNLVKCVVFDDVFVDNDMLVHPNILTASLSISYDDMMKFLDHYNHKHITIKM